MNSRSTPFDWTQLRAFLVTAEEGSLSAAARKLMLTQPTLSRQVAALEADLGLMLFERIGRTLDLTQAGLELLEHARAMGEAADRVALTATGQSQSVSGLVRITASDVFSAHLLPPVLHRLRDIAPDLRVEIIADNGIRDLMRREADIAIRHVRPDQPELIARLIRQAEGFFYAATSYLDARGRPDSTADFKNHDFVSTGDPAQMIAYLKPLGIHLHEGQFRTGSQSGLVAWELTRQGFGITPMSDQVGDAVPGVERVVPDMEPITFPVWLATHRELHTSRKIRLVFDVLAEFLARS
jgi:DNA-binding transcriptional LysR family regulator